MGISNSRAADNRRKILAGIRGRATTGDVFYVDAGATGASDTAGRGKTPSIPFATIDFAIGEATANQGDVIIVLAGHTETVTNDSDLAFDKAGISVIGLGEGTLRPTITMSLAVSKVIMSTADCVIENILFLIEHDVVIAIEMTATDCSVIDCEFRNRVAATAREFVNCIDIGGGSGNDADRCVVSGCKFTAPTLGSTACILISQVAEGLVLEDLWCFGDFSSACIFSGAIHTNCIVKDCMLTNTNTGDHALEFDTTSTGILLRNFYMTDMAFIAGVDPGACNSFECFATDAVDLSGALAPVINTV